MDTWVVMTAQEVNRERRRQLSILTSRGMAHSNRVRDFELTDRGLHVLEDDTMHTARPRIGG
jgi:circadian clock protein KaiC